MKQIVYLILLLVPFIGVANDASQQEQCMNSVNQSSPVQPPLGRVAYRFEDGNLGAPLAGVSSAPSSETKTVRPSVGPLGTSYGLLPWQNIHAAPAMGIPAPQRRPIGTNIGDFAAPQSVPALLLNNLEGIRVDTQVPGSVVPNQRPEGPSIIRNILIR